MLGLHNGMLWGKYYNFSRLAIGYTQIMSCPKWHIPWNFFEPAIAAEETFCVVRNPYDRILSHFRSKHKLVMRFSTMCEESVNLWVISTFAKEAVWPPERAVKADCHFLPQHLYVQS